GEHDLGDRPQPGHGRAHGGAHDRLLRDRGVPHPPRSELLEQADSGLEDALGGTDVLAETDHAVVAAHLPGDPLRHRLPVGDRAGTVHVRHVALPSAHTSVIAVAGSGAGAALAAAIASATSFCARASAASMASS